MADKKLSESIKKFQKTVTSVRGGPLRGGVIAKKKSTKMQEGGAVPAKFKGFSKLPEKVQQKMNPDLAQKYENGGEVRGARSAISGRGFKGIR